MLSPKTNTAISKLSSLFGSNNTNWIEVDFSSWSNDNTDFIIFNTLKTSILEKSLVSFNYFGSNGTSTSRRVEPLKLCFKGQDWYLYALCRKRMDYRFFKLRRIKELTPLIEKFTTPIPYRVFSEVRDFSDEFICVTLKLS